MSIPITSTIKTSNILLKEVHYCIYNDSKFNNIQCLLGYPCKWMEHFNFLSGSLLHPGYYLFCIVLTKFELSSPLISLTMLFFVVVLVGDNQFEHILNSLPSFPFLKVKYLYPPISISLPPLCVVKKLHSIVNWVS